MRNRLRTQPSELSAIRVVTLLLAALLTLAAGCGGNGSNPTSTSTGSTDTSATSAPLTDALTPPLEGPPRQPAPTARTDFRELVDWQLPRPEDVSAPPADATGAEFSPPEDPECPQGWDVLTRPTEKFEVCHPPEWQIAGHGYVSGGEEERWYSVGIVLFDGTDQEAHVSVYLFPRYSRPARYTIDCAEPYRVTFAGEEAVLCAEFPPTFPEQRLISYNVLFDDIDYFVNVVSYQGGSQDALATAIEIAHTFKFLDE